MHDMSFALTDDQKALKAAVYDLCKQYSPEYWRDLDAKREYPDAFVSDLTKAGYLAVLIPQEYGGAGVGVLGGPPLLGEVKRPRGDWGAPRPRRCKSWPGRPPPTATSRRPHT